MFVFCRKGHLVFYLNNETGIFLEKESAVFLSRRLAMDYLQQQGIEKEKAVEIIKSMQKNPGIWISV